MAPKVYIAIRGLRTSDVKGLRLTESRGVELLGTHNQ